MTKEETIFNQAYLDRYTKEVQLKIAEQIIDDIPSEGFWNENVMGEIDLTPLKDQLRKKYLN